MRSFGVLVGFLAVSAACGRPHYPASVSHPLLGQRLPELHHRQTLDGQPFEEAQLVGRPVLIKFFADYCQPCKNTLPAAERVHEAHPGFAFVGIAEDERSETARAVVQRFGLTFPVIHDQENILSARFRVTTMPMTIVADAAGVVRWVGGAEQSEDDMRRAVEAALP